MITARTHTVLVRAGVAWSLGFAALHLYWALGGRWGVPADSAPIGSRPWFLAYDVGSALIFGAAALVAARLVTAPTPALLRLTTWGAALALLRGGVGLVQDAVSAGTGHGIGATAGYDVWFAVAGGLFLVIVRTSTASRVTQPTSRAAIATGRR